MMTNDGDIRLSIKVAPYGMGDIIVSQSVKDQEFLDRFRVTGFKVKENRKGTRVTYLLDFENESDLFLAENYFDNLFDDMSAITLAAEEKPIVSWERIDGVTMED